MINRKYKITLLDLILLLVLLSLAAFIIYKITTKLNYHWQWGSIPQFLFRYDQKTGGWTPNYLMQGLFTTLRLSIWSAMLAIVFGTVMGLLRTSKSLFNRMIARTYVELMRNLPPLVIIFIFYFFLSDQIIPLLGIDDFLRSTSPQNRQLFEILFAPPAFASAFISALFTLAVFESAYIAEIIRAGIESVEKGQWEAAFSISLSKWHTMRFIILPQALQRMLPALGGQFISLVKDTSIVSVISIQELAYQGTQLMTSTYMTIEVWITVSLMYLILTLSCSLIISKIETRLTVRSS